MHNDSIETLLLRHYGHAAPTPAQLEQQIISLVGHEANVRHQQERIAAHIHTYRMSRRRAVKLVAISSAGLGVLGVGLDILEAALSSADNIQAAFP